MAKQASRRRKKVVPDHVAYPLGGGSPTESPGARVQQAKQRLAGGAYAQTLSGYEGQRAIFPASQPRARQPGGAQPIRAIHVGHYMVRAGIETWLKALLHGIDPNLIKFERCVVASPMSDPCVIREMPVPVEVGQEGSVRRAAQDCDVLLVSGPAEVGAWLGEVRRPLCVFVAHGDSTWSRNILESCTPVIDHVIAVSKSVERQVCNGFHSTVIYNGIDTSHLTRTAPSAEIRSSFGFGPKDFVVGSVMRFSTEKQPQQLVEAIAVLPRRFKLLLVGWGSLRQKLLDLANEIAPGRCVVASAVGSLGDYYSAFDAFCLPSSSEGFGLATLEAMFCGVPVVTTGTGFAPELLVDRVHYIQCDGTSRSIAASIELLAQHPRWAAGLAAQGRSAAEQFGFAGRMCREYEGLLTQLWEQHGSGRG